MSGQGIGQILVYSAILIVLAVPLGRYMAWIYTRERDDVVERGIFRLFGRGSGQEQDWKSYAKTVIVFSLLFTFLLYAIQRLQGHLFLNPDHLKGVSAHIALNTTASFVTNTNWQYYGGEYTMSYLSQMAGLAVQNFVSAGVGMAVLAAVVRGVTRRSRADLGNFWRDLYRSIVYILLPLSIVVAVILISQGVPQTFHAMRPRHGRGRAADDCARPRRLADRGQAARDERRRLLQLELGRSLREPERLHELHRADRDPADPGRPGVHVRVDGAGEATRMDGLRGDVRDVRVGVGSPSPRSSTARRCYGTPE